MLSSVPLTEGASSGQMGLNDTRQAHSAVGPGSDERSTGAGCASTTADLGGGGGGGGECPGWIGWVRVRTASSGWGAGSRRSGGGPNKGSICVGGASIGGGVPLRCHGNAFQARAHGGQEGE